MRRLDVDVDVDADADGVVAFVTVDHPPVNLLDAVMIGDLARPSHDTLVVANGQGTEAFGDVDDIAGCGRYFGRPHYAREHGLCANWPRR